MPALTLSADPAPCHNAELVVANSAGSLTSGVLFIGVSSAELPTAFGGTLLVVPVLTLSIPIPKDGLSVVAAIPCDPSLACQAVYLQVLEVDSGASRGLSFTRGLRVRFGEP